jgi:hypothetical protein
VPVAETTFGITYDGPALADGVMPVRELAPALLALGDLFASASILIYPDREPVALHIKATAKGSFDVHLILEAKRAWDELVDVFGSDGATALANLFQLVAGVGGGVAGIRGVLWLIKRLKGRRIIERDVQPGTIRLTLDDDTIVEVPADVLRLYESIEIRRKARDLVEPLTKEGIDRVSFKADVEGVVVEKADVPAYDIPEAPPQALLDTVEERILEIVSVVFEEGRKWRFTDGHQDFSASIEDESFIARIDAGERFGKGDMLRCRVRIVQVRRVPGGLRTDYSVLEVLEHVPPPTQLSLDG